MIEFVNRKYRMQLSSKFTLPRVKPSSDLLVCRIESSEERRPKVLEMFSYSIVDIQNQFDGTTPPILPPLPKKPPMPSIFATSSRLTAPEPESNFEPAMPVPIFTPTPAAPSLQQFEPVLAPPKPEVKLMNQTVNPVDQVQSPLGSTAALSPALNPAHSSSPAFYQASSSPVASAASGNTPYVRSPPPQQQQQQQQQQQHPPLRSPLKAIYSKPSPSYPSFTTPPETSETAETASAVTVSLQQLLTEPLPIPPLKVGMYVRVKMMDVASALKIQRETVYEEMLGETG